MCFNSARKKTRIGVCVCVVTNLSQPLAPCVNARIRVYKCEVYLFVRFLSKCQKGKRNREWKYANAYGFMCVLVGKIQRVEININNSIIKVAYSPSPVTLGQTKSTQK